jgi:hypothetical protein
MENQTSTYNRTQYDIWIVLFYWYWLNIIKIIIQFLES